MLNTGNVLGVA